MIQVEFFGVARLRSGTAITRLPSSRDMTLAELWDRLLERFPQLDGDDPTPRGSSLYRFNLDGERFVTDPLTPINHNQCVLIFSADAGG